MIFSVWLTKDGKKFDIPESDILEAAGNYEFNYRAEDYYYNITEGKVTFSIEDKSSESTSNTSSSSKSGKKSGGGGGGGGGNKKK